METVDNFLRDRNGDKFLALERQRLSLSYNIPVQDFRENPMGSAFL
jgi:hypothetical protein